jgi:hypothetical protein
VLLI